MVLHGSRPMGVDAIEGFHAVVQHSQRDDKEEADSFRDIDVGRATQHVHAQRARGEKAHHGGLSREWTACIRKKSPRASPHELEVRSDDAEQSYGSSKEDEAAAQVEDILQMPPPSVV